MSTRGSVYYHEDKETNVTIHVYYETSACDTPAGLRLEVVHPYGVTNVAWSASQVTTGLLEDASPEEIQQAQKEWPDPAEILRKSPFGG
jgi:hypothetical protein